VTGPGPAPRSVAFDRAAEYYDATRRLRPATHDAIIGQLAGELAGRGTVLEVGVGTGRIALDLHRRGVSMIGVDLSVPMMRKLVEKAGGAAPFPLAVADATALPFRGGSLGAVIVCHVLHLVSPWQRAVEELGRVVRPGGVILVELVQGAGGPARETGERFWSATTRGAREVRGLDDLKELGPFLAHLGLPLRMLPPVVERGERTLDQVIARLEAGTFSSCWEIGEEERRSAAAVTREWARGRFGPLDTPLPLEATITWHAYDAPGGR
jgi:SAM-dependent methyltransferase